MFIWKNMAMVSFLCNVEKKLEAGVKPGPQMVWNTRPTYLDMHSWLWENASVFWSSHAILLAEYIFVSTDMMSWKKVELRVRKKIIFEFLIAAFALFFLDCQWKNLPWTKDRLAFVVLKSAWTVESSRKSTIGRFEISINVRYHEVVLIRTWKYERSHL